VRIFSPSSVFSSYIEGIIPELGEDDVITHDFPALLKSHSPGHRLCHGPYEQIDFLQKAKPDDKRLLWLAEKYSQAFLDELENAVRGYAPAFEDVVFYKDIICEKSRLEALYGDRTSAGSLMTKTTRVFSYVAQAYVEYCKKNRRAISELFTSIYNEDFTDGEIQAKFDEERNVVFSDLRNRLMPAAQRLLERHLRSRAKKRGLSFDFARHSLRQEKTYYEDALLLFYIDIISGRIPQEKAVKHILLDEAQDFCILHHRILRALYPSGNFTVLADTNQALYPAINLTCRAGLEALYPQAGVISLSKSYRSTYEISRFASQLLDNPQRRRFPSPRQRTRIKKQRKPRASRLRNFRRTVFRL
jgi:DNA helicase-2/ATP-dependent DNA helicase PcrA